MLDFIPYLLKMNFQKIIVVTEKNLCDLITEKYFLNKMKEEN
jgi:hypothetical protein